MNNISRNIVNTRKLANKGRFGDTEIRNIDNKPAHVNAWEASVLDSYGKSGEGIVKSVGSGTINPSTGLREYGPLDDWGWWFGENSVLGQTWEGIGNIFDDPQGWWDQRWATPGEAAMTEQAHTSVVGGIKGLVEKFKDYMGPSGFLGKERRTTREGLSRKVGSDLYSVFRSGEGTMGKSGFAGAGAPSALVNRATTGIIKQYQAGIDTSKTTYQKGTSDVRSGIKSQMNQMLIDYHQATGYPFDVNDPSYVELMQLLDPTWTPTGYSTDTATTPPGGQGTGTTNPPDMPTVEEGAIGTEEIIDPTGSTDETGPGTGWVPEEGGTQPPVGPPGQGPPRYGQHFRV